MSVATARAKGTGYPYCRDGARRIVVTMDEDVFDDLKAVALRNNRSIAEEVRLRIMPVRERAA